MSTPIPQARDQTTAGAAAHRPHPAPLVQQPRPNDAWLPELCGQRGQDAQRQAHLDLANYLYVVAYNYLLGRQAHVPALVQVAAEELAALSQDFVQDTLEKLARDHFARLRQYRGEGRFTAWAAQIIRNQIAGALRLAPFTRRQLDLEQLAEQPADEVDQATQLERQEAALLLQECLQRLPAHYRTALVHCIAEGEPAQTVADQLQKNVGAIHLLVMRAKRQMKACLEFKGVGKEVLGVFA